MHTNGQWNDETEPANTLEGLPAKLAFYHLGAYGADDESHAMGRLYGATLTDRVLQFLERYDCLATDG